MTDTEFDLGILYDEDNFHFRHGIYNIDQDDLLLIAMLQDNIYAPELMWDNPNNHEYSGCYRVRDYQYPLFRNVQNYAVFACGRSVGKTESLKARGFTHAFRRTQENLLISAPELIHLLPLTDAIEDRVSSTRLTREFLDAGGGKTGFTHRPFGIDYKDGTKIVGRIPRLKGTGVKGQHQPDLAIDEGQDYPDAGWTEVHETVEKDHVDKFGKPDFNYEIFGVHSGNRASGFHNRIQGGGFKVVRVTALQRPGWDAKEKAAAKAAYGGSDSFDYRRNILGEAGGSSSAFFVMSRLMACIDQDRDSQYNQIEYAHEKYTQESLDEEGLSIADKMDLPSNLKNVWFGADLGLTSSPTEILMFSKEKIKGTDRLKLVRRFTLKQCRTRTIREAFYAIARTYGQELKGGGIDVTGLGFPLWQEMEDDENAPGVLMDAARGYFFNSRVPVHVGEGNATTDDQGRMRDQYGNAVVEERDPNTGQKRLVTYMPMIEASTRYIRKWIDDGHLLLPFDPEIAGDMMGETQQRVRSVAGMKTRKPNAFHILDAVRAAAMAYESQEVEEAMRVDRRVPVLDMVWNG